MDKKGIPESERGLGLLRGVNVSRVQPSSVSEHPDFLYPSVYDILNIDSYMPRVCLYRLDITDPLAFSNFVHSVKSSLSQVLSLFYPLAGKWIVTQDAWIRKLFCNGEGAVFVEAAIDEEMDKMFDRNDLKVPEELTGDHAVPGFKSAARHKTPVTNEFPCLIIQVIRFKCGGVALTVNYNHMTMDGFGLDRFLKAWSEIARTGQTDSKPVFDRSVVVSHLQKSDILGITLDSRNVDDNLSGCFKSFDAAGVCDWKPTRKLFRIRKDVVERLRQKVNEENVSDLLERPERFTTFECVTAQLWRCFARIPSILSGTMSDKKVQVVFPVEGRRKWNNPSLPEDFIGNVSLITLSPKLPCSEVSENPLSFGASHIHKSVSSVNHQTSGKILDLVLSFAVKTKSMRENLKTENHDEASTFTFFLTAGTRFHNVYNLDFGYGGPFSTFPCGDWSSPVAAAVFLMAPAPNSGNAAEMLILGPAGNLNILCEDPEFIELVS